MKTMQPAYSLLTPSFLLMALPLRSERQRRRAWRRRAHAGAAHSRRSSGSPLSLPARLPSRRERVRQHIRGGPAFAGMPHLRCAARPALFDISAITR
ncbi:hypothetical protein [Burkholderia singularis]|uniref:hypothetical protein n=1 Tax=Burkholderia singularis TaxID=1503053 RepID=UPI0018D2A9F4|nr:hypothetical protein [Burkholderia sp. Bp7605]